MKPSASPPNPTASRLRGATLRGALPRIYIVLCLVLSASLLWWSVSRVGPVVRRQIEGVRETERLASQITQLEFRRRTLTNQVPPRHDALLRQFFEDQGSLTQWLDEDLNKVAASQGFHLHWKPTDQPSLVRVASNSILVYRIHIDLSPDPARLQPTTAYHNLLQVLDRISRRDRWCIIENLEINAAEEGPLRGGIDIRVLGQPTQP